MRTARWGAGLLTVLVLVALAAPLLAPYDPTERAGTPFGPPSAQHLLGTNDAGNDLLSELVYGARVSLLVGVVAALAATLVGGLVGVLAGYARGWVDSALMRLVDVVLSLPVLPLTIVIGVFAGPGLGTQIVVIASVTWAEVARELRAQVLSLRERDHVQALRAMGAGTGYMLPRHVLPAVVPLVVPQFVLATKTAIMLEASLAFLGLGDVTVKSWGTMLSLAYSRSAFLTDAWLWWVVPPGLGIALTVLAFALLGYGFEERARPVLRDRRRSAHPPATPPRATGAGSAPAGAGDPLRIDGLTVRYRTSASPAVHGVSLTVRAGETVALVGASGSGKSTVAAAVAAALPPAARVEAGRILLAGTDLTGLGARELRRLRGATVGLVPQEAMSALNPVRPVRAQVAAAVRAHRAIPRAAARARADELLRLVGLDPARGADYPHQFSGGMRQRAVVAVALAADPAVLVADEPTTGLDVLVQAEVLDLLDDLRRRLGLALLLVTHDLPLVARIADRVAVLHDGSLVDTAAPAELAAGDRHPATRALWWVAEAPPRPTPDAARSGATPAEPLLRVRGLTVGFTGRGGRVSAVRDLDLDVAAGAAVGLVGGSGAGKSTVAHAVAGLVRPDAGSIRWDGTDLCTAPRRVAAALRRDLHLVFQDPYAALPPHRTVAATVAEPLVIHRIGGSAAERTERVAEALAAVHLPSRYLTRYPHQLSGGERQRVALARAVVTRPRLILADEPTRMLDATLRVDLVDLLDELRAEYGLALLHITHDLTLARLRCDRLVVLDAGTVVEEGQADTVFTAPRHPRTAALVAATTHRGRTARPDHVIGGGPR